MMRLDKFLSELGIGTRSEVKALLKKGLVTVNGEVVKKPECKVDESRDEYALKARSFAMKQYSIFCLINLQAVLLLQEITFQRQ